MRISDWSSDVCSSDLDRLAQMLAANGYVRTDTVAETGEFAVRGGLLDLFPAGEEHALRLDFFGDEIESVRTFDPTDQRTTGRIEGFTLLPVRSEEHTSELPSLMRISYAVFCLKKKKIIYSITYMSIIII